MRQCLTSPEGGYYTSRTQGRDQFGQKGDFITSPEISQIFGELLGIWLVAEWMAQGKKSSGVEIIEVGPGRGTLMDDMLRTVRNFKSLAASIESIYLVEASPALRDSQKQLLCGDAPLESINIGFKSRSKYANLPITWCEDIRFVPNEPSKSPFIFAHEFFDALPIHAFQSVAPSPTAPETKPITGLDGRPLLISPKQPSTSRTPQWRELLVTPTTAANPTSHSTTTASSPPPDFQLSLSKASTPSSLLLPEISTRYQALKPRVGSTIEISPESHSYVADFARRIGGSPLPTATPCTPSSTTASKASTTPPPSSSKPQPSGAALILDYGPLSTIPVATLRGIRSHALVSPFLTPGLVDLSADVDFTALAEAAVKASPGVEVHGPVEQGGWLERMGVRERGKMLGKNVEGEGVRKGVERLVERGGGGMGRLYKVMAIVPEGGGRRRPVGFGGEVVEE
ncbi:hypothetical protein MMC20_004935 [Loxospora ochrophaea]|nr:hypothetical protein [Loxospora ochrophaea]